MGGETMRRSIAVAAATVLFPVLAGTALADSRSEASLTQIGTLNVSFAEQRTDSNIFMLEQIGRGNTALVKQNGKKNSSGIAQLGIINVSHVTQTLQASDNEPDPGYLFLYSQNGFNYAVLSPTPMSFTRIGRLR